MKKLFVDYDIALKLRELGFGDDCFGYYVGKDKEVFLLHESKELSKTDFKLTSKVAFRAPTWEQAINWFISRFNLYIETPMYIVDGGEYDGCYAFKAQIKESMDYKEVVSFEELLFPTKVKAQAAALNKAIEMYSFAKIQ